MSAYRKQIVVCSICSVSASVQHIKSGDRVGSRLYQHYFRDQTTKKSLEIRLKKAHEWADAHIKLCEEQEVRE